MNFLHPDTPNTSEENLLITPKSLSLSLSAPRAPPHGSLHRNILTKRKSSFLTKTFKDDDNDDITGRRRRRTSLLLRIGLERRLAELSYPHPHLPSGLELTDRMTRALGATLPLSWQNRFRDSGSFRSVSDTIVTISAPALAMTNPFAIKQFLQLGNSYLQCIPYGTHSMQQIHLYECSKHEEDDDDALFRGMFPKDLYGGRRRRRGLVFFVHGGAWGSGLPWMYRLCALPFLSAGMTVAIIGYRTYPDARVEEQVSDLDRAAFELSKRRPDLFEYGCCIAGHSSGAHIGLLWTIRQLRTRISRNKAQSSREEEDFWFDIKSYIGLSGPYSVSHHFDYEANRGVEEISPMKPACGYTRQQFDFHSPALRLAKLLTELREERLLSKIAPRMLLVHGMEDSTVPFTATADAARLIRSCGVMDVDEMYLGKMGHQDTVMEMMLGGRMCDGVMKWLVRGDEGVRKTGSMEMIANSRL